MAAKFKIKIPAPRKNPSGQGRVPHVVTPKVNMGQAQRRIYSKNVAATNANPMSFPWGGFGNTGMTGED
jgi:hypothetical protein